MQMKVFHMLLQEPAAAEQQPHGCPARKALAQDTDWLYLEVDTNL